LFFGKKFLYFPKNNAIYRKIFSTFPVNFHFWIETSPERPHRESTMESCNLLVLQSGVSGAVGNSALYGVLSEALNHEAIEEVYGVCNGFEGILSQNFIDLAALSQKKAQLLLSTAGNALGHEAYDFQPTDETFKEIIGILSQHNIKLLAVIGDAKSIEYTQRLLRAAKAEGYELRGAVIPQSNDNELPMTDHGLGYGSSVKCLNALLTSFERILRNEAIPVGVCEVENAGSWIVAGAALLSATTEKSVDANDLPYIVCLPEQPFNAERFLTILRNKLQRRESILVVTHSQLINEEGNPLDISGLNSVGAWLEQLIQSELSIPTCLALYNLRLQPISHFLSKQDQTEAVACGCAAVQALVKGESEKAIILVRNDNKAVSCEPTLIPLKEITGIKFFPSDWISADTMTLQYSMLKYTLPLIQGEVANTFEKGLPQLFRW